MREYELLVSKNRMNIIDNTFEGAVLQAYDQISSSQRKRYSNFDSFKKHVVFVKSIPYKVN